MKFLLWRCSLPLVLVSSSSWPHPPLGYFKAVLMFYDSFPSFLLEKKRESQPRHSTFNSANSWCVIWKSIFYCEGGGYSRNKKLFLLDQYQFLEGSLPYTPAHLSFTTHVYTHGSYRAQQWHFLQNYKIYSRETKVVPEEFLPLIVDMRLFRRCDCGFTYFLWKSLWTFPSFKCTHTRAHTHLN